MSSAWILPALYASIVILTLTLLFWPVSWLVRRHHKTELAVVGRARQAYRATRVFAGLSLAVLIGWLLVVSVLFESVSSLNKSSDPILWLLQIAGAEGGNVRLHSRQGPLLHLAAPEQEQHQ